MNLLKSTGWSDTYARLAFPILVQWVEETAVSGALRRPVTYKQIARVLGVHHRSVHWALGAIGDAIEQLHDVAVRKWGTSIPPIEVLVCRDGEEIPGEGAFSFISRDLKIPLSEINKMPATAKKALVSGVHDRIYSFAHWREVLGLLELKPLKVALPDLAHTLQQIASRAFGAGGESKEHKALKLHIYKYPSVVGIKREFTCQNTEETILSGDRVDILWISSEHWFCVEVKPAAVPDAEIVRGLLQCLKYKTVLSAQQTYERMQSLSTLPEKTIDVRLALGGKLPKQLEALRKTLGVNVVENVIVPAKLAATA